MTAVHGMVATVTGNNSPDWLEEAGIVRAAAGFQFTEGAAWHPGQFFLFSDTPANKVYRLCTDGNLDMYIDQSGWSTAEDNDLSDQIGSNAIAVDGAENIFLCQHGNHAIAKLDRNKKLTTVINQHDGRPFNSPNDLIIHSDGTIFFTDPPYGLAGQVLHPDSYQPFAGIYQYRDGVVHLVGAELNYPNGLVFSPDEKHLLVSSNHSSDKGILRYSLSAGGHVRYDGFFMEQHADGMTIGNDGNIYMATDDGVLLVSPAGEKLALIPLPETPSNLCWGGPEQDILFVTARTSVYFILKRL